MNSLAALFYIMTLFFYARGRHSQAPKIRWLWWGDCALAGILSFGSKQTAATSPFFIVICSAQLTIYNICVYIL